MKNNEFQTITKDLFYLLDSFKETALTKQRALIENNMDSLDKCISAEEKLLFEVQSLFKRRAGEIENFPKKKKSQSLGLGAKQKSDGDQSSQQELFKVLKKERDMISKKVKAINLINEQNRYLTEQSRGFIKSLVGELVSNSNKKILDVKA